MKHIYLSLTLLCSVVCYTHSTISASLSCPCIAKDGGNCCCASRDTACNCVEEYAKNGAVSAECPCPKTSCCNEFSNPVVEVSYGELFDKVTILEIKAVQIHDEKKRNNVLIELSVLNEAIATVLKKNDALASELLTLKNELADINWQLWQVEDALRIKEARQLFDAEFIALARSVYKINNLRANTKTKISTLLNSHIVEEKSYAIN